MKNKKGNIAVFALILVIVAVTTSIITWAITTKTQTPVPTPPAYQPVMPVIPKQPETKPADNATVKAPSACDGQASVTYNGDVYPLVEIGEQCWFQENLRTTKKPDGTKITEGIYCHPAGCGSPWGRQYTWPTAMNGAKAATGKGAKIQGICPPGWHIPSDYDADTDDDFKKLSNFLGGDEVSGGKLKKAGEALRSLNAGATNSSGFTAVLAGNHHEEFYHRGNAAYFWSSAEVEDHNAWGQFLSGYDNKLFRNNGEKGDGWSVRCVKN